MADDSEVDDVQRWQWSIEEDKERVQDYNASHPDDFAGLWLDNDAHLIRVRFASNVESHRHAIACLVSAPETVDVGGARFAEQDLAALHELIDSEWDDLGANGIDITLTGIDVVENLVRIGVRERDADVVAFLENRYGADRIRVTQEDLGEFADETPPSSR